ncbi:MAG: PEP-CTERM sorting domain-containing protein, partial [Burkholderiales bacterium]|nr:PEP-CTERM sorting domain-containing protein [Burkholderiales bacterium]MDE2276913.1 PEP-CTERM sorting domain-containing protein [Burkholderiales bacterium]
LHRDLRTDDRAWQVAQQARRISLQPEATCLAVTARLSRVGEVADHRGTFLANSASKQPTVWRVPMPPSTPAALARFARDAVWSTALLLGVSLSQAAPVISQAGNLLINGNFESGMAGTFSGIGSSALSSWNQYANTGPVTSSWVTSKVVDGTHSALMTTNRYDGLYQYQSLASGTYTLSGWVYVLTGSVNLGLAWNGGSNAAFSVAQAATGAWEYLSITQTFTQTTNSYGGALVYGAGPGGSFYADGLWLNAGSTSTSGYAPSRGFNPNAVSVPEPGSLALVGLALLGLALRRAPSFG